MLLPSFCFLFCYDGLEDNKSTMAFANSIAAALSMLKPALRIMFRFLLMQSRRTKSVNLDTFTPEICTVPLRPVHIPSFTSIFIVLTPFSDNPIDVTANTPPVMGGVVLV